MLLKVNIIGAGRLGKTLGKLLSLRRTAIITGVCNSTLDSTHAAIDFIGAGKAYERIEQLPSSDVTFITVPDDLINQITEVLSHSSTLQQSSTIIHCSGALTSNVLSPLQKAKCKLVSAHPMRSFANPGISINEFDSTYCALEGSTEGILIAKSLFESIGGITHIIDSTNKARYHAAAIIASNYLVTLADKALACFDSAGIDKALSIKLTTTLMHSILTNLERTESPKASLTGPIARADIKTIELHLKHLEESINDFYRTLGLHTIPLSNHTEALKAQLSKLFNENKH